MVEFRKAIELDPKLAQAHMSLGLMLVGFGKSDEARKSLQTALISILTWPWPAQPSGSCWTTWAGPRRRWPSCKLP